MKSNNPSPILPPEESTPEVPRGLMARFRKYFLTGLVVAGPVAITLYLTWWCLLQVLDSHEFGEVSQGALALFSGRRSTF